VSGSDAGSMPKCESDAPNQTTQKASTDNSTPTISLTACSVASRAGAITIWSHLSILISSSQARAASDTSLSTSAISGALEILYKFANPSLVAQVIAGLFRPSAGTGEFAPQFCERSL